MIKILTYKINEYSEDAVKVANSTSRQGGATSMLNGVPKSLCLKYILEHADMFRNKSILDFGAGKLALQTKYLLSQGFEDVTAYDFGTNLNDGIHDPNALRRKYDVIMASNVLNVSSSEDMLRETLMDMKKASKPGTVIICNYPNSPRKWVENGKPVPSKVVKDIIEEVFGNEPVLAAGTNSTPVWEISL